MILILKENNSTENMTDEQLQHIFDTQKSRISDLVESQINLIVEKLFKYQEAITDEVIKDVLPSYYLDNDGSFIVASADDFDDRLEQIKNIKTLQNCSDELFNDFINDNIIDIMSGD